MGERDSKPIAEHGPEGARLVGIGASAGGLEALRELMESLPDSDTLSYVIAQHVSPTHVSMLVGLLAPLTRLGVQDLVDRQCPEPGVVYITPPNKDVVLENGVLRLTEPQAAIGPKPSVNHFFHSLASELGEQAIGIILSGTGSDGAAGIRAIKAAGGITIAQEPASAKYDGMPRAAIHTGSIDLILPPGQIGPPLERLVSLPRDLAYTLDEPQDTDEYAQISSLVRLNAAFKLDDYKSTTVRRRIARRMGLLGIHALREYIALLKANREESQNLMHDIFIGVTAFFRDPDAFLALERVIAEIVKSREDELIRCWVPGCASGEEAYSIAMLFEEALATYNNSSVQYMIFASDLDDEALAQARAALYPIGEADAVPILLRDRYLEAVGDHYRIRKSIRNRIVFTRQNVIEDPPFGRLDLVSCRNLLIYLNPRVQKRVLEVFHYALNPGGYLFLDKSESVDQTSDLFRPINRHVHIYERLPGISRYAPPAAHGRRGPAAVEPEGRRNQMSSADIVSLRTLEVLTARYAPPSLVIDGKDSVVHMQGELKPFLNFPQGRVDMYLFDLVDAALRAELRALVFRCRRDRQLLQGSTHKTAIGGRPQAVTVVVSPLDSAQNDLLLIAFQARPVEESTAAVAGIARDERDNLIIAELEQELAHTRTHLNVVVEELETSNEELQSVNEELQATNEELQSTNEELQTSNEELQSINEELLTVNEELQLKSAELETTAGDLINVKESLTYPLMVVDSSLQITQLNRACRAVVVLDTPLEGSSLNTVPWRVEVPGLAGQVQEVIRHDQPFQTFVGNPGKAVYALNIMPYRLDRGETVGAILAFEDITVRRRAEQDLRESEERFRSLVTATSQIVWNTDAAGGVMGDLPDWRAYTGQSREAFNGRGWLEAIHPDDRERTAAGWASAVETRSLFEAEYRVRRHDGVFREFAVRGVPVVEADGRTREWVGTCTDITDRKIAERALRERQNILALSTKAADIGIWVWDLANNALAWDERLFELYQVPDGVRAGGVHYDFWRGRCHPDDLERAEQELSAAVRGESPYDSQFRIVLPDGSIRHVQSAAIVDTDPSGKPIRFVGINRDLTGQKETEQALRESEARIRRVIDIMPEAILVIDERGRIQQVNERTEQIFGHERSSLLGQPLETLIPSRLRDVHASLRETFAAKPSLRPMGAGRDLYGLHQDGREVPVEVALAPLVDGDARLVVASVADITERKRAEQALLQSERRFRQVTESLPQLIWTSAADGPCDYLSPQWVHYTGKSEAEQLGYGWLDQLHPDDRQGTIDQWMETAGNGKPFEAEFRIRRFDGIYRWFHTLAVPLRGDDGTIIKWFGSNTDIDDRKRVESALRESKDRHEAAASAGIVGVWDWDVPNDRLIWDGVMYKLYGIGEEDWGGAYEAWASAIHPDDKAHTEGEIQAALRGEREYAPEFRVVWPDGSVHHIKAASRTSFDAAGAPVRMIGVNYDVTELKAIQRNLLEARDKAEAANRSKSDFLANISHEIRTPMNAVMGLGQLLLDTELTTHQRNYLRKLNSSARSLLGILNDILDYSKIEAGKVDLESIDFEMAEVLESTATLFNLAAEDKGIALVFDIPQGIPPVLVGDPLRFKQIINNLLGNAIKFTRQGHVRLSFAALQRHGDDLTLKVSVGDTGIGMTPQQVDKLFQPFQQADTSTTRKFGGTGLGLTIVKHLVDLMGGEIAVESEPGRGSTFSLTVRLKVSATPTKTRSAANLRGMRTLIIDDQEVACDAMKALVTAWSFQADVACSGDEGLEKALDALRRGNPYELVLVDWKLPGIDGIELARRLRAEEAGSKAGARHAIVVMVTAHGRAEAQKAAPAFEFDGILEKPVIASQLFDLVASLQAGGLDTEALHQWGELQHGRSRLQVIRGAAVLLVEDNPTNQMVAREMLRKLGLKVTVAGNGQEAIGQASANHFDAILMDLQMPELDGIEATRRLRALPQGADIPIIAMTAAAMLPDREASQSAGMNDFVSKPIDVTELSNVLLRWILPLASERPAPRATRRSRKPGKPFAVPGLALEDAVLRLGGDWGLLRRAVEGFSRDAAGAAADLQGYLAQGQWQDAQRLAHTTKGLARSIGADALHSQAEQLEKELAAGQSPSRATFEAELAKVLESIATLPPNATERSKDAGKTKIEAILRKVQDHLSHSQFVPFELLDELAQGLRGAKEEALCKKLQTQVDVFDYEKARRTLGELAALCQTDAKA